MSATAIPSAAPAAVDRGSVLDAYRLLQGFPNKTMETGQALWQLSRRVPASPAVLAAFAALPAGEVIPALERSPEG